MLRARSLPLAAPMILALSWGAPVVAQGPDGVVFGAGYTANAPKLLAGGSAWALFPVMDGLGVYVDFKASTDSPANIDEEFLPDRTAAEMEAEYPEHFFRVSDDSYRSINGAIMKSLTEEFILYLGGGWVERTHYAQFYDETAEFGRFGFYWVEDPDNSSSGPNFLGGVFLRIGPHLRAQFGGETRPAGFTVGIAVNFPAF